MDIEIIVFDGFDELDAIGPFEVLRHAANAGHRSWSAWWARTARARSAQRTG